MTAPLYRSNCPAFDSLYDNLVNNAGKEIRNILVPGEQPNTWYCEHGLIVAALNDNSLQGRTPFHNVDPACIEHHYETTTIPAPLGA